MPDRSSQKPGWELEYDANDRADNSRAIGSAWVGSQCGWRSCHGSNAAGLVDSDKGLVALWRRGPYVDRHDVNF